MVAAVLLPVALVLAGWHYWTLYSSLTDARQDLLSAQARISDVGLDMTAADIAVARERLDSAGTNVDRAQAHLKFDPLLQAARIIPGAGDQVNAVDDFLEMADLLVQIGDGATTAGTKAVELREAPPQGEPLTQSLIELLTDTGPEIERIQALTEELVAKRIAMGDEPLLPPLDDARERLDEELPKLANAVEQVGQARALLPGFLGFDGERNYLVFALNSGELLPGGGLVTAAGILPVTQGVNGPLEFIDSTTWLGTWRANGGDYIEPPGPLKRYLLRDWSWNLLLSNWNPDYTTWSQQALEFYELVHGEQDVDGVVAVDLTVLERLLAVTGPKTIDVPGEGPVKFDANNAVITLEIYTRHAFEPVEGDRKSVIGALANVIIADLLTLPSDRWADAVDVVRKLGEERHIQVLSFRPEEQTIIRDVRWDGRLEAPSGDWVHFNEASVMSTKLNLIIKPEGEYEIDLNELGDARHRLSLRYHNGLPEWAADKEPELVPLLMLSGLYGGYLRLFGPDGMTGRELYFDGEPRAPEDSGAEGGKEWFGTFMPLAPGDTHTVTFEWTVALAARSESTYELYIQKQAGTDGMCLALEVTRIGEPARELIIDGGTRDAQGRVCLTTDVRVTARF